MKIRYAKHQDYDRVKEIWKRCFIDSQTEVDFYFENIYREENCLVLEEENSKNEIEIKASMHANTYPLSIGNEYLTSKFLVALGVLPEYRGKGYMQRLFSHCIKESNYPFVYLSAINPDLYRKYGFEYISEIENYTFNIGEIPVDKIEKGIEIIEINSSNYEEYIPAMIDVYEDQMKEYFLYVKRDKAVFAKLLKEVFSDKGEGYIFYNDKVAVGYLLMYRDEKIMVRELFAKNIQATRNILAFIKSYRDYYGIVEIKSPQGKNMNFYFKNQKKIEKGSKPYIMGRIVEAKSFFKSVDTGLRDIKIKIKDDFLDKNNGVYYFNCCGEVEKLEGIKSEDWNLEIDIASLGSLVMGYLNFETLEFLEKIKIRKISKEQLKALKLLACNKVFLQDYQ